MTESDLPLFSHSQPSREPFSRRTAQKSSRLRGATVTEGLCPYCAVGCGQLIYTKAGQLIDIEGNPDSPINEGTLCPKGANAFQLAINPHRVTQVLYRGPYSDHWETRSLDWALDQVAHRVKDARDAELAVQNESGRLLNSVRSTPVHYWSLASTCFSRAAIRSEPKRPWVRAMFPGQVLFSSPAFARSSSWSAAYRAS